MTYHWHPQTYVTDPRSGLVQCYRYYWWVVDSEGYVCLWDKLYPQCNSSEYVTRCLMSEIPGAVDCVQIPLAFVNVNVKDLT